MRGRFVWPTFYRALPAGVHLGPPPTVFLSLPFFSWPPRETRTFAEFREKAREDREKNTKREDRGVKKGGASGGR